MANKIPLYETGKLSIDPSATGEAAFQQAGRRIGPAYNEAGTLTRSIAEAQAAVIRQRKWPFDMLELERSLENTGGRMGGVAGGGGVGIKLEGGVNNLLGRGGSGGGSIADDNTGKKQRGHTNATGADVGAHALSAAALGRLASGLAAHSGGYHNSVLDPLSGRDINSKSGGGAEGISVIDTRTGMDITKLPKSKYDTVLDKGVLRKINRETGEEVGKPTGAFTGPNADADRAANAYARDEATGSFDPRDDQGKKNIAKFRADNGYDPNSGRFTGSPLYTGPQDDPQREANTAAPYPPVPEAEHPSTDPWWRPSIDDLKRQLSPGGDSPDVTEGREDTNVYGRDAAPRPSMPAPEFGGSGSSDGTGDGSDLYGGGGDEE